MKTYKNINSGDTATETWLKMLGHDVDRPALLEQCGWLEIRYDYPQINPR